ncbi:MAG: non-canonical purine NTP pyrophosphatase [Sulfobacillus sp.]|nr:non-canonical purine NTP pyrophosphatase [Sulfobacillus sp.]
MNPKVVVLASHNPGKLREFAQLFQGAPFELVLWPGRDEIIAETGDTYVENARIKAHYVARQTGHWALADDSGIEVDYLGGLPGVNSAHFVSQNPWENTREILLRLMDAPPTARTARMRAVLCLASPDGAEWLAEGVVEGWILPWPRGTHGFGVDPIFSVNGRESLAEWPEAEKNAVSHRARAVQALWDIINEQGLF